MSKNSAIAVARYVFGEIIGDFFYAPVWWYSRGFLKLLVYSKIQIANFEKSIGLKLWIKSLGKPMYGQYDITGKLISFCMRLVVLFARFFAFIGYVFVRLIMILVWLVAPVIVVWQVMSNIAGLIIK